MLFIKNNYEHSCSKNSYYPVGIKGILDVTFSSDDCVSASLYVYLPITQYIATVH